MHQNPTSTIIIWNFDSNCMNTGTCCCSHNQYSNFVVRNNNIFVAELDANIDAQQASTTAKPNQKLPQMYKFRRCRRRRCCCCFFFTFVFIP